MKNVVFNVGPRYPKIKSIDSYDNEYNVLYNYKPLQFTVTADLLKLIPKYPTWIVHVIDQSTCYYGILNVISQSQNQITVEFDPRGKGNVIDSHLVENENLVFFTLDDEKKKL
jgi:hypothetical protein